MKTRIHSILSAGYGHKKVTIEYSNGKLYSATTTDMPTFDEYNSGEAFTIKQVKTQKAAEKRLIRFVKRQNNLR